MCKFFEFFKVLVPNFGDVSKCFHNLGMVVEFKFLRDFGFVIVLFSKFGSRFSEILVSFGTLGLFGLKVMVENLVIKF